jgi:Bacterial membrane protein YfhO
MIITLTALRLIAVYGASAAVVLWIVHRFVMPLRLAPALVLAVTPALLTGKAMITGGVYAPLDIAYQSYPLLSHREEMGITTRNGLLIDVVTSYIPSQKAVREAVKNGRLPLWNRFHMAGEPLLAFQQPAVLFPGTWLGFLLPLAQAWTFDVTLRSFFALLAAYLFLRDLRLGGLASYIGAFAWAFSDHLVFWMGYSVGAAVGFFPLLLLALRRLVSRSDFASVVLTIAALCLMISAGHPETVLHGVAGAGIYFSFELWLAGRGRRLRPILLSFVAGAFALGLCAVLLLPFRELMPYTHQAVMRSSFYAQQKKSVDLDLSLYRSGRNFLPYATGLGELRPATGSVVVPAAYAGALVLPLALVGLLSRRREKWGFALLTAFGLALWARLGGITDLVSRLPLFDIAVNDYLVFLAAFGACALAGLGAQELIDGRGVAAFVICGLASIAVFVSLNRSLRPHFVEMVAKPHRLDWQLPAQVAALALAVILVALRRRIGGTAVAAGLCVILVAERGVEAIGTYPTWENRAFFPPLRVFDDIRREAPERTAPYGYLLVPNVSALYEIEDVRGYGPMTLLPLAETYPLWCVDQSIWFNRIDDVARPFLAFLNVRYALVPPTMAPSGDWRSLAEGDGIRLLENPKALPRAFLPAAVRFEPDGKSRVEALSRIADYGAEGIVGAAGPPGLIENGGGETRVTSYSGQEMTLRIRAGGPAIVGTSIPAWPGWKLKVDGQRASLLSYNHAFLGFRVPEGEHEARLFYLPDAFLRGAAISGTTALAGVVLLWRRRRAAKWLPVSSR